VKDAGATGFLRGARSFLAAGFPAGFLSGFGGGGCFGSLARSR
jgi:hypothetical protein